MISHRTPSRTAISVGVVLLAIGMFTGCTPKSEPTPTPTPTAAFASEEEAFAAAEEVYRAYNEAVNARIRADDKPDPQDYLGGTALEDDIDGLDFMRNNGVRLTGHIAVQSFMAKTAQVASTEARIIATVCLDVTGTQVVDGSGADVTPLGRPGVVAQEVTIVLTSSSSRIVNQAEAGASSC